MGAGFLQILGRLVTRGRLASPPSVWGKLPSQGDFVHHRCPLAERQAWQNWVDSIWPQRPPARPSGASRSRLEATQWISLDTVSPAQRLHEVPIAFVMPPMSLPSASAHYLQGVMLPSKDKVGRACPLIIYQKNSPAWMHRAWHPHAEINGQNLLFWWARLAWQATRMDVNLSQWFSQLDAVWAMHEPGVKQWLGAGARVPDGQALHKLLGPLDPEDPGAHMRGVRHLPWTDWPERILRESEPVPAFWTQDAEGRYVQAASSLAQLWRQA